MASLMHDSHIFIEHEKTAVFFSGTFLHHFGQGKCCIITMLREVDIEGFNGVRACYHDKGGQIKREIFSHVVVEERQSHQGESAHVKGYGRIEMVGESHALYIKRNDADHSGEDQEKNESFF